MRTDGFMETRRAKLVQWLSPLEHTVWFSIKVGFFTSSPFFQDKVLLVRQELAFNSSLSCLYLQGGKTAGEC